MEVWKVSCEEWILTSLQYVLVMGHIDFVHTADNCAADAVIAVPEKAPVDSKRLDSATGPACNFVGRVVPGCVSFDRM